MHHFVDVLIVILMSKLRSDSALQLWTVPIVSCWIRCTNCWSWGFVIIVFPRLPGAPPERGNYQSDPIIFNLNYQIPWTLVGAHGGSMTSRPVRTNAFDDNYAIAHAPTRTFTKVEMHECPLVSLGFSSFTRRPRTFARHCGKHRDVWFS